MGSLLTCGGRYTYDTNLDLGKYPAMMPGSIYFTPTADWLSDKLEVPISAMEIKEEHLPGTLGQGGSKYLKCSVTYAGSATNPDWNLPKDIFVKMPVGTGGAAEYKAEGIVAGMCKRLPDLPVVRVLWSGPDAMITEDMSKKINKTDYIEGCYDLVAMRQVLDAYASVHAAFWNIEPNEYLRQADENWHFFGNWGKKEQNACLAAYEVPTAANLKRVRDEIGFYKLFQRLNSGPVTLCQGDAHAGQVMWFGKGSNSVVKLIDFGWAIRAHPAIDLGGIIKCLQAKSRREHTQSLLRYYWMSLTKKLGEVDPGMTFDEFFEGYKLGVLFRGMFYAAWHGDSDPTEKEFFNVHFRFFDDQWLESLPEIQELNKKKEGAKAA